MRIEFKEDKWGAFITLHPETIEETGQLLRFARNAKAVKPDIHLSFSADPICYINMIKIKEEVQIDWIKPNHK